MAILTDADKKAILISFHNRHFAGSGSTPWTKPELSDGMDAINNWVDANQASFVADLSANASAFSSASSAAEKTLLFAYVIQRRAGVI